METKRKESQMLKVSSILMIIGGVIAIIAAIAAFASVGTIHAILGDGSDLGLLYGVCGLTLASGVFSLVAGIAGISACQRPEKAGKCMVLGIIVAAFAVISQILSLSSGNQLDILSLITGLLLPAVYIVGANKVKNL
uniref:hypothetical protein n=1 Tax=Ndongobacter massiliensis TaxID=1871025 RepID=UPI0009307A13|nr:hypothetical protein [Ndongobacter massiliensis]